MLRKWRSGAGLIFSLGLILAMVGGASLGVSRGAALASDTKVSFCHASPPDQFRYEGGEPHSRDADSIIKQGHGDHSHDIIPVFSYTTFKGDPYNGHYPGKNLDKLSWIANGCAAPPVTSPTPHASPTPQCSPTPHALPAPTPFWSNRFLRGR